jgi:Transglutaminase-like superfamily/Domain of Unknown Function with PDB structure (DUF3857)
MSCIGFKEISVFKSVVLKKWGLLLGMLSTSLLAFAQQLPNPHIKINRLAHVVIFEDADRVTKRYQLEMQALTPEGAQAITKAQIGFNSALDDLKIIQAKTIKADGREIRVETNGFALQKGYSAPGVGVTLPEWEIREINFPDVKVGDKVFREVVQISLKSPLPGFQNFQDYLMPNVEATEMTVRIEAPQSLKLSISASPTLSMTTEGNKQVWTGKFSNTAAAIDDNATSIRPLIPHVMVSTVASNQDLGQRFAVAMIEKAVVTPEIDALAKRLTEKATTDEQKVRAVYDWIRKEIKYAAIFMGVGGWVPNDTTHIMSKRYGDCKDHVTLMHALLKAVGVEVQPALINTFPHYELDPVPLGFNHVISYIPALKKFLDPTSMNTPFESVPHAIYGKPVVVSDGRQAALLKVPPLSKADNTVLSQTTLKVAASGAAEMTLKVKARGHAASLIQDQLSQIPTGMGSAAIQRILQQSGLQGTGFLRHEKVNRDSMEQTFEAEMSVRDLLKNSDAGATVLNPPLNMPIYVLNNLGNHQQERRTTPYVCNSMKVREEFSIEFEEGFKLNRVPSALNRDMPGIRFASSYQQTGNKIEGWREIEIEHAEQECSPTEYRRRRLFMLDAVRHLRSQVIYER